MYVLLTFAWFFVNLQRIPTENKL